MEKRFRESPDEEQQWQLSAATSVSNERCSWETL
jgi:hypothetical protein